MQAHLVDKENAPGAPAGKAPPARKRERTKGVLHWGESADVLFMLEVCPAASVGVRRALAARVQARHDDPTAWWALLAHVSAHSADAALGEARCRVYRRATQCIPRQRPELYETEAYVAIWLGYAREQAASAKLDDALEALRYMRSEGIGRRARPFYEAWAACEIKAGRAEAARDALRVGIRSVPSSQRAPLEAALAAVDASPDGEAPTKTSNGGEAPAVAEAAAPVSPTDDDDTGVVTLRARDGDPARPARQPPCASDESTGVVVVGAGLADAHRAAGAAEHSDEDETVALMTAAAGGSAGGPAAAPMSRDEISYMLKWQPSRRAAAAPGARAAPAKRVAFAPSPGQRDASPAAAAAAARRADEAASSSPSAGDASDHSGESDGRRPPPSSGASEPSSSSAASAELAAGDGDSSSSDGEDDEPPFGGRGRGAGGAPPGAATQHTPGVAGPPAASGSSGGGPEAWWPFRDLVSEKNSFRVEGAHYAKLALMGRGGSSKVFRVLSTDAHVLALKRIKIRGSDRESMAGYANEITLLRRLRGKPGIITMHAADVDEQGGVIQMIMEAGDADLATVLQQRQSLSADGSRAAPERSHVNFVRLTWQQMLEAVDTIHEERIVHGDLKPANFLFVQGRLRLIDFGIARAIKNDTTNIYRDTQIGTLNYMSPEAIRDSNGPGRSVGSQRKPTMRLGRASDVWSLGCILYQMIYGRTPFGHLQLIQKLQAIIDPGHSIDMPLDAPLASTAALECLRGCMQREPADRPPICGLHGLLSHPFLEPSAAAIDASKLERAVAAALARADGDARPDARALTATICAELGIAAQAEPAADGGGGAAAAPRSAAPGLALGGAGSARGLQSALQLQQRQLRPVPAAQPAVPRAGGLLSVMEQGFEHMPSVREETTDKTMDMSWQ